MSRFDFSTLWQWSSEEHIDRLFYFGFYMCVGLVPPLISIAGHKALHISLFLISALIFLRLLTHKACRQAMISKTGSPAVILLFCFAILVALNGLIKGVDHSSMLRILGKSLFILQITMVLLFIWSQKQQLNGRQLLTFSLAGVVAGLVITVLKIIVGNWLGAGFTIAPSLGTSFLQIHDMINDALKIIAVFVFFAVCSLRNVGKRAVTLLALLAVIFIASFTTLGFDQSGSQAIIIAKQSETVQFGIPLALLVLVIAWKAPVWTTNVLFTMFAFILVNAPWLFQWWIRVAETLPLPKLGKVLYRAEIWEGVAKKIIAAPFLGYGIDSVRYLQHIDLANRYKSMDLFHHPHNMVLQIWLDLGLLGVLIVLALGYLLWRFVSLIDSPSRPFVLAGITMLAVFALVTHSFWQTWNLALLIFVAALVSLMVPSLQKS